MNYEQALQYVLTNGVESDDRTGVGTLSVFGIQMRFDLSTDFPLITSKRVHWRSVVGELLWMLSGSTNNNDLEDRGVTIWREWADSVTGDLGPVYGHIWRYTPTADFNQMIEVSVKRDEYADFVEPTPVFHKPISCDLNTEEIWAIEQLPSTDNPKYRVQLKSGFITEITRPNWRALKSPVAIDGFARKTAGVGFLGAPGAYDPRVYALWRNMMLRCYDKEHPNYHQYGQIGISVSPYWHSFERFNDSLRQVPLYTMWLNRPREYSLDKDYYGSKVYSPTTCVFLPHSLSTALSHDGSMVRIKGETYATFGHFENVTGIRADYFKARIAAGRNYKDYIPSDVEIIKPTAGKLFRQKFYIDQIKWVVDEIRKNPSSRRLIVSAWSPSLIDDMALPPCHTLFQLYVRDGKLSCHLYQRSADMFWVCRLTLPATRC